MKAILILILLSATSVSSFGLGDLLGDLLGLPKEPELGMTAVVLCSVQGIGVSKVYERTNGHPEDIQIANHQARPTCLLSIRSTNTHPEDIRRASGGQLKIVSDLLDPSNAVKKESEIGGTLQENDVVPEDRKNVISVVDQKKTQSQPEMIAYNGYPVEIHNVVTEDGYILTLHRIPKANNGSDPKPKPPALLQHGLMCASDVWVWNTPDKNLAYILADKGFDVWLGNFRGNQYSSNHTTLNSDSKEFWDFSWDEMAKYDLAAMIDYILNVTSQPKLWYIGHSMGTSAAFALLSTKTEYNDKVKNFTALAPVVTVGHMKSPIRFALVASNPIGAILAATGNGKLNLDSKLTDAILNAACGLVPVGSAVCSSVTFALFGPDFEQLNQSRIDFFLTRYPAPTSVRTVLHFAQNVESKKFNHYDFGPDKNLIKYSQTTPPEYNITKITAPVSLFYGENDWLASPEDVEQIPPKLQNLVFYFKVLYKLFSHQDFLWAIDVKPLVYNYLIEA